MSFQKSVCEFAPSTSANHQPRKLECVATYLVAIPPEKVLGPDVLVWVFNSLFQRREMFPMLPMLVPQVVRVDTGQDEAGSDDATTMLAKRSFSVVVRRAGSLLYGQFTPEV